jgi:hypothetical protein
MQPQYFRPIPLHEGARAHGCLTCAHFQGQFYAEHAVCERFEKLRVIGDARIGCAYWEREPGADDE